MSEIKNDDKKIFVAKAGLEDVVAGTSEICFIDGKEGKLIYSIPDTMKLGNTYTITIRIKKNTNNVKIIDSLYKQKIVDIKVTN